MSTCLKDLQAPITIDEQIDNLQRKKLIIDDLGQARAFLCNVSYFRFIKAYSLGLKPKNGDYYDGVTFNQLSEIYEFNRRLRQIIFPLAENIEIRLRCSISNFFSCKYGNLGHEDPNNFQNEDIHTDFIEELNNEIARNSKNPFVINFSKNYKDGKLPLYASIELFSFGMLSKFYSNLKNEDKKAIAKDSFKVGYTYFESWIESIAYVRNICAHYGRLYNVKLVKQPQLYKQYKEVSNYRIFSIILCFKHLITDENLWRVFTTEFEGIVEKYEKSINLNFIGLPIKWKDLLQ